MDNAVGPENGQGPLIANAPGQRSVVVNGRTYTDNNEYTSIVAALGDGDSINDLVDGDGNVDTGEFDFTRLNLGPDRTLGEYIVGKISGKPKQEALSFIQIQLSSLPQPPGGASGFGGRKRRSYKKNKKSNKKSKGSRRM